MEIKLTYQGEEQEYFIIPDNTKSIEFQITHDNWPKMLIKKIEFYSKEQNNE